MSLTFRSAVEVASDDTVEVRESIEMLLPTASVPAVVSSESIDPALDSDAYAAEYGVLLAANLPGYEEVDLQSMPLLGTPRSALRRIRWHPPDGEPVQQLLGYCVREGRGYHLTITMDDDGDAASVEETLRQLPAITILSPTDDGVAGGSGLVLTPDELGAIVELTGLDAQLVGIDLDAFRALGAKTRGVVGDAAVRRLRLAGLLQPDASALVAPWDTVIAALAAPDVLMTVDGDGQLTAFAVKGAVAVVVEAVGENGYRLVPIDAASVSRAAARVASTPVSVTVRIVRVDGEGFVADEFVLDGGNDDRAVRIAQAFAAPD